MTFEMTNIQKIKITETLDRNLINKQTDINFEAKVLCTINEMISDHRNLS